MSRTLDGMAKDQRDPNKAKALMYLRRVKGFEGLHLSPSPEKRCRRIGKRLETREADSVLLHE
jgi:hypothetical protein